MKWGWRERRMGRQVCSCRLLRLVSFAAYVHSTSSTLYSTFTTLSKNTTQLNIAFIFQRFPPASPGQRVRQITFGHDAAKTCMHTYRLSPPSLFDLTASQMDSRTADFLNITGQMEQQRTQEFSKMYPVSV